MSIQPPVEAGLINVSKGYTSMHHFVAQLDAQVQYESIIELLPQ